MRSLPDVSSLLDIGCGNGQLLKEAASCLSGIKLVGVDVSSAVLSQAQRALPKASFVCLDVEQSHLAKRFDVVVCMEVIEHCGDYKKAIRNVAAMSGRWLIITVPCGPVFEIDRRMGHYRHFSDSHIRQLLEDQSFVIRTSQSWGFPFFNMYKHIINLFPDYFSRSFLGKEDYGFRKRVLSIAVRSAFALCLPCWGYQLFVLAERTS